MPSESNVESTKDYLYCDKTCGYVKYVPHVLNARENRINQGKL